MFRQAEGAKGKKVKFKSWQISDLRPANESEVLTDVEGGRELQLNAVSFERYGSLTQMNRSLSPLRDSASSRSCSSQKQES